MHTRFIEKVNGGNHYAYEFDKEGKHYRLEGSLTCYYDDWFNNYVISKNYSLIIKIDDGDDWLDPYFGESSGFINEDIKQKFPEELKILNKKFGDYIASYI